MMSDKDESVDMELRETLRRWNAPGAQAALEKVVDVKPGFPCLEALL